MIFVNTQTKVFLEALALGFALGLFYDVFRILRLAVRHGSTALFLEDFFYFTVCACLTFLFALSAINGHVRAFVLLGELLGAVLYRTTLGCFFMSVSKTILRTLKAAAAAVYRVLLRPFVRLFFVLKRKLRKMLAKLRSRAKKLHGKAKYSLKRRGVLVYNLYARGKCPQKQKTQGQRGEAPNAQGKVRRKRKATHKRHGF